MVTKAQWDNENAECAKAYCEEARKQDSLSQVARVLSAKFHHPKDKDRPLDPSTLTKALDSAVFQALVRSIADDAEILLGKFRAKGSEKGRPEPSLRRFGE